MKTENEIAKENVEKRLCPITNLELCKEHLATCQRFLEFLEDLEVRVKYFVEGRVIKDKKPHSINPEWMEVLGRVQAEKRDNQNAIKTYGDAGIK